MSGVHIVIVSNNYDVVGGICFFYVIAAMQLKTYGKYSGIEEIEDETPQLLSIQTSPK